MAATSWQFVIPRSIDRGPIEARRLCGVLERCRAIFDRAADTQRQDHVQELLAGRSARESRYLRNRGKGNRRKACVALGRVVRAGAETITRGD